MNTYVLTRHSTGYGELKSVVVQATDPMSARLIVIAEYRHTTGITDFVDDQESTLVEIADDAEGVIGTSFAAE